MKDEYEEYRIKKTCPKCGKRAGVIIFYGMPQPDISELAEQKVLVLGGCCFEDDNPKWYCLNCKHEWGSVKF